MKNNIISNERALEVIRAPQISEKSTFVAEKMKQVIFHVSSDANKSEVKLAIEQIWKSQNIQVKSVQIANVKGQKKVWSLFWKKIRLEKSVCKS